MSTPPYLDLPNGVEAVRIATPAGELAALEARPAGTPRGGGLLVPGFTGSKEDFLAVLPLLRADGWHVLAYDQRGQYESSHGGGTAYDVATLASDALEVAERLAPGPRQLLGHSFGGLVARAAVLASPAAFAGLTLLCTGPAAIGEPSASRLRLLVQALGSIDVATIYALIQQLDAEAGVLPRPRQIAEFLERRFLANDPRGVQRIAEQLLEERDQVAELLVALTAHHTPVLVARGADDDAWPHPEQRAMADRLGASYVVLPAAAHSPAAEAPEATAELLCRFWATGRA